MVHAILDSTTFTWMKQMRNGPPPNWGYIYIILNAGHWFARCSVYCNNQQAGEWNKEVIVQGQGHIEVMRPRWRVKAWSNTGSKLKNLRLEEGRKDEGKNSDCWTQLNGGHQIPRGSFNESTIAVYS
ncbi:hypothetical protein HAX54_008161 [Datura stramonium]|uniref:Uncharacterized protein n=1 Tax=Datura stramonium TaxID=4076 RepID=A0ABS8RVE7_DATST|nr:hypothetical protein [Datura stramonium]